jgi:plastocyanin
MKRSVWMSRVLILPMLVAAVTLPAAPLQAAKQTWTVIAGGSTENMAVVSNAFSPRAIEVAVGDTITWVFQPKWPVHTVSFLSGQEPPPLVVPEGGKTYGNPQVFFPAGDATYDGTGYRNSGLPSENPLKRSTYSLTFTKAGTYPYVCLLHGAPMSGTVTVKDQVTSTPAAVRARGRRDLAALLKAGQAAFTRWTPERQGNKVVLPMVGDPKQGWTILRFTREPLVIRRGTTVTWTMRDPSEVHIVTFPMGQKGLSFLIPQPQRQGPPKLLLDPRVEVPTKIQVHDGKSFVNSGILFPPGTPASMPKNFSLTFGKPGRYDYVCVIHALEGMTGTIVVK